MATPLTQPRPTQGPIGQKGPRGEILVALKRGGRLTARELAERVGLSLNAVRHHLKELEVERLVVYEREQRGVGAPAFAYRLSDAGEALFPSRYQAALTSVLDHVVAREGRASAVKVLEAHFEQLARRIAGEVAGLPPAERARAVAAALTDEGYMAEWTGTDGAVRLVEHHCPIRAVAERFPELCAAEARFLETVLGATVERTAHMLNGCGACEYHVQFAERGGAAAPAARPALPEDGR